MERYLFNLKIAFGALLHNKIRSLLTALGIIFGVASVIAMQAVGKGTQEDLLNQMKLVGVNNIMINQKIEDKDARKANENNKANEKANNSFGLSIADGQTIKNTIPQVSRFSPETGINAFTVYNSQGHEARLLGVSPEYFSILSRNFESGRNFDSFQMKSAAPVCILSAEAKTRFFHSEPAIGRSIRCRYVWLQVIGVLKQVGISDTSKKKQKSSDNPVEIFTPVNSMLLRFGDHSFITKSRINARNNDDDDEDKQDINHYNQVDRLIVQVVDSRYMETVRDIIARILKRRHSGISDFEIKVPEAELQQEKHTKDTFNLVLGIIAGISLLVGGIGIMNIMLVSVTERTKEIGLRMALGARKLDVIQQFLAEAVMLSSGGGLLGVALGIIVSKSISGYFHIPTIFTLISLIIAFGFSVAIGLIFGIAPARRAARQNPIESLRYE
jgi:putative ABC transport system permease protein